MFKSVSRYSVIALVLLVPACANPSTEEAIISTPAPSIGEADIPATPEPASTADTVSTRPDLTIRSITLHMKGRLSSGCYLEYSPFDIGVTVENIGSVNAGRFAVALNSKVQEVADGLPAGDRIGLIFSGTDPSGFYVATADIYNQVGEFDEENNDKDYHAPTATPPPLCTSTPDPAEPEATQDEY